MDQEQFQSLVEELCDRTLFLLGPGWKVSPEKKAILQNSAPMFEQLCQGLIEQLSTPTISINGNPQARIAIVRVGCEDLTIYGKNDPFLALARSFDTIRFEKLANDLMEIKFILHDVWVEAEE